MAESPTIEVRDAESLDDLQEVANVFAATWGTGAGEGTAMETLRAVQHAGSYVALALSERRVVGASLGFLGFVDGAFTLHSHKTAVLAATRDAGVGLALKRHQRDWCLARSVDTVMWTFDPLVRRNAHFNLERLGARVVGFHERFYGEMTDALNRGDESDRCDARWDLRDSRVAHLLDPGLAPSDPGDRAKNRDDRTHLGAPNAGGVVLRADERGWPVVTDGDGLECVAWIPPDIVALRAESPECARAWRLAFRTAVGSLMGDGFQAVGMTRDGWYKLRRL